MGFFTFFEKKESKKTDKSSLLVVSDAEKALEKRRIELETEIFKQKTTVLQKAEKAGVTIDHSVLATSSPHKQYNNQIAVLDLCSDALAGAKTDLDLEARLTQERDDKSGTSIYLNDDGTKSAFTRLFTRTVPTILMKTIAYKKAEAQAAASKQTKAEASVVTRPAEEGAIPQSQPSANYTRL